MSAFLAVLPAEAVLPAVVWRDQGGVLNWRGLHGEILVGSAAEAEVCLAQAPVSRRHCRLWLEAGEAWIEDLGSVAGTFVNGHHAGRQILRDGDLLVVGGVTLAFLAGGERPGRAS